jgi:uncharacterized membrane protein
MCNAPQDDWDRRRAIGEIGVHPFDIKAALLEKHAQHVAIIHFPIALFIAGFVFDLVAKWRSNKPLATVASYNFVAAGVSAIPAVSTGLLAWQFALQGTRLKGILLYHLILGSMSSCLLIVVACLHYASRSKGMLSPLSRLALEFLGVLLLIVTGYLGGFLSGVNGAT